MRAEIISCYLLLSCVCNTLASNDISTTGNSDGGGSVHTVESSHSGRPTANGLNGKEVQPLYDIDFNNEQADPNFLGLTDADTIGDESLYSIQPSYSVSANALRSGNEVQPLEDINSLINVLPLKYHLEFTVGFGPITNEELPFMYKKNQEKPLDKDFYGLVVIHFIDTTGGNTIKLRANSSTLSIIKENTMVAQKKRVEDYVLAPNILEIATQEFFGEEIYVITMKEPLVINKLYAVHLCFFGKIIKDPLLKSTLEESDGTKVTEKNMFLTNFGVPGEMSEVLPIGHPDHPTEITLKIFRHKDHFAIANTLLERSTQLENSVYVLDEFMPVRSLLPTNLIFTIIEKFNMLKSLLDSKSRKIESFEHTVTYDHSTARHEITFRKIPPGKKNVIGLEIQKVTGEEAKIIVLEGYVTKSKTRSFLGLAKSRPIRK